MKRTSTTVTIALVAALLLAVTVGGYAVVAHERAVARNKTVSPPPAGDAVALADSATGSVATPGATGQESVATAESTAGQPTPPTTPATTPATKPAPPAKPPASSTPPVTKDPGTRVPPVSRGEERKPLSGRTVFVDAGHGIAGSGANGPNGGDEAKNNLATALILRDLLESAGARVVMTRTTMVNPTIPGRTSDQLEARTIKANESGADIFVSLHENFNDEYPNARGLTVYYRAGSASQRLAEKIDAATIAATGWYDWGTQVGTFYVLRNSTLKAAVLVECGFLSNATDERLLGTDAFRRKIATGLFNGIVAYFE
ncbi:MAG: N-acetylmuramoyl-L-alanine amidase family protein [Chloroflexota bacterium]